MNDDLVGAAARKHFDEKGRLLQWLVAWMRTEVVNCKYQRIATEQGQRQVKPQMDTLVMDYIR